MNPGVAAQLHSTIGVLLGLNSSETRGTTDLLDNKITLLLMERAGSVATHRPGGGTTVTMLHPDLEPHTVLSVTVE